VAVLVLVLLVLGNTGLFGKTADQYFTEATKNLASAPVVKVRASYIQDGTRYAVNYTTQKDGGLTGSVTFKGSTDDLVSVGGKSWVKTDKAYWDNLGRTDPLAQKVLPGHWLVLPVGDALNRELHDSADSLRHAPPHTNLKKGGTQTTSGQPTVKLSDSRTGDLYVTTSTPTRLVRLVYAPGYTDAGGVSGMDAYLSYPETVKVTPPTEYFDPTDPQTLPAEYTVDNVTRGGCDQNGCGYTISVHNHYGRAGGQATVTVNLSTRPQGGTDLGSCSAPIPPIDYNHTENVACTVRGAAWTNFYNAGTGTLEWYREATVHNPIWDD
jgi:hypothetical protein